MDAPGPPEGCFDALGHRFAVDGPFADELELAFAALRTDAEPDHRYLAADPAGVDRLVASVNAAAVAAVDGLAVHAAAVASGDRCVVLHAAAGTGKSTLAAALVRAGCAYVTDEVVAIGRDRQVRPFPKPLSLKAGAAALLPDLDGGLAGARARYVPAPGPVAGPTVPAAVVSLVAAHGERSRLRVQRRSEALAGLAASCFLGRPFGADEADLATAVVAGATCAELAVGDLPSAVAFVADMLQP